MKLTLVRHGQTVENAHHIIQGQSDSQLTDLGREQVELVSKSLKNEKFEIIYCSDLKRCVETADIIRKYHKDVPLIYTKTLREFSFGIFQGLPVGLFQWAAKLGNLIDIRPPGVESNRDVRKRVVSLINQLITEKRQNVLFVTHGGTIEIIDSAINHKRSNPFGIDRNTPNGGIWSYEVNKTLNL